MYYYIIIIIMVEKKMTAENPFLFYGALFFSVSDFTDWFYEKFETGSTIINRYYTIGLVSAYGLRSSQNNIF